MKHLKKTESASYDVTIMQTIPADQLAALEQTYTFMLAAVREAIQHKRAAAKQSAQILRLVETGKIRHDRRCLKVALMMRRGSAASEISITYANNLGSISDIKRMGAHGRALFKHANVHARQNFILKCYVNGIGPRPAARMMPQSLGTCSPGYACKIIKTAKMRDQTMLPYPLIPV